MSFSLDAVRKYSPDSLEQKVNEMSKELAKFQSQNNPIENDDIVGWSDSDHSNVKFYDELNFHKKFIVGNNPVLVFEPDGDKLACWYRFMNLGWYLKDYSTLNNDAEIFGEPCLTEGIDLGFFGGAKKSVASKIDNTIYYKTPTTAKLQIVGKTVGHSIFARFSLTDLAQQGGQDITFGEIYDDASNYFSLRVAPDGTLKYFVRRAGTNFFNKTASGTITINTVYDAVVTYANSGNAETCYVNDVTKTLSSNSGETPTIGTDTSLYICSGNNGARGLFPTGSIMYDFRRYDEKILSSTHAHNLFTNKISISSAAFGEVAATDGCVISS